MNSTQNNKLVAQILKWLPLEHIHSVHGVAARAFFIRIVSAVIAFVLQVFLARWMGAEQFGVYIYVWTWTLLLGGIATFGFSASQQKFIPQYIVEKDDNRLRGLIWFSHLFPLFAGFIFAGLIIAAIWIFKPYMDTRYVYPLAITALCLPAFALTEVQGGMARAYNAIELALIPTFIIRPILIMVIIYSFNISCKIPCASNAITSTLIACWAALFIQSALLFKMISKKIPKGSKSYEPNLWIKTSLPIFLMESFYLLLGYTDVIILSKFVDPEHVAIYFAALKILSIIAFVQFSVSAASAHRFSTLYTQNDHVGLNKLMQQTTKITFWPSLLGCIILLALGTVLLKIFGQGFEEGYPLMFILALGLLARAATGSCEKLLVMTGHQIICSKIYAYTFIVNMVLCLVLIPYLGATGAAVAITIAYIFESIALTQTTYKKLGIKAWQGILPKLS